jgi:hypothetical protein
MEPLPGLLPWTCPMGSTWVGTCPTQIEVLPSLISLPFPRSRFLLYSVGYHLKAGQPYFKASVGLCVFNPRNRRLPLSTAFAMSRGS